MVPFPTILSRLGLVLARFTLALLCLPAVSVALLGASVALASCKLGHVPSQRDPDVDVLGYGALAGTGLGLLVLSYYLTPLLVLLLAGEWLTNKRTWIGIVGGVVLFVLPWLVFYGCMTAQANATAWVID